MIINIIIMIMMIMIIIIIIIIILVCSSVRCQFALKSSLQIIIDQNFAERMLL